MANQLAYYVHLDDDKGEPHVFGPDDTVPAWARKKITNPSAWADGEADPDTPDPDPDEGDGNGDGEEKPEDYSDTKEWTKATLQAEIDNRNKDREGDDLIEVEGTKRDDLVAALVADNAAQAADDGDPA